MTVALSSRLYHLHKQVDGTFQRDTTCTQKQSIPLPMSKPIRIWRNMLNLSKSSLKTKLP